MPLWAQVLDDLRRRLTVGEFAESFPADRELIATYGVSRHTAREAVRRLQAEGLLERERGRGTTVRAPVIEQRTGVLYSLFRSIEDQGFEQRSKVLTLDRRKDPAAAHHLGLPRNSTLLYLNRVRFAADSPLAVDEIWLPDKYSPTLLQVDFEHTAVYNELQRLDVQPTSGWEHLHPALADTATRHLLGIPAKQAVFVIERYTEFNGEPLEWRLTTVRGDHYSFVTTWSATDGGSAAMQRHPD